MAARAGPTSIRHESARLPGFVTNVTWQDNQTLWITSVAQASGAVRVIKATAAGTDWANATTRRCRTVARPAGDARLRDPRDPANTVGPPPTWVYRTVNGGTSWEVFSNGLPTVRVNDIYMPPDGSFMRIATYGRGIWELSQIELVETTLVDDGASCDRDGVLDNGETGNLVVTFMNQGPNNLNHLELTVTSSNPHVTFPNGNVVKFPPLQKHGESTGSIRVALSGAVGLEPADFHFSILAPELELDGDLSLTASHRVNYDDVPASSATETVESANPGWTIAGDQVALPNITSWQRRELSATRHVWWGPDNNGQRDGIKADTPEQQMLVSPPLQVGVGPLTIAFQHRFAFEAGNWDGGVIELSTDNGGTWVDVGAGGYNGATNAGTSAPIGANRPAFVTRMVGWPNFAPVMLNLGTTYAGQTVRIRFRIGADETTGAPGWDIDDIVIGGLTELPFSSLIGDTGVCTSAQQ